MPEVDTSKFSLDPSDRPEMVKRAIRGAKSLHEKQMKLFHQGDYFFAGHQWSEEDEEYLRSQERPVMTFNRIMKTLMVVLGVEIAHRQEPLAIARNPFLPGQKELAELTTTYLRWVLDQCDGDEERSWAFFDLIRRGVGWEELSLAYDTNPDGMIMLKRVDGLEMWWDPASKEPNLRDSRWRARRRFMPYEEVLMLFGEDKADQLTRTDFDPDDEPELVTNISPIGYAPGNSQLSPGMRRQGPYIVTQFQWWGWEEYYRTLDPDTIDVANPDKAKIVSVKKKNWSRFEKYAGAKGFANPRKVTAWRKEYRQTFVSGSVELQTDDLPVPDFTLLPMTGLWDDKEHLWFAMVKPMVPPQEWANKFMSQTMDIMNRSRKNALLVHKSAVDDPRKFENDINGPGAIGVVNDIEGVKEIASSHMPDGLQYLLESSIRAIPDISGVNVELMGASEGDQPGVTTQYRQTQGLTVLAPYFNAERRLRMAESRLLVEYGRRFVADGRLMTLSGPDVGKAIPLFRQKMATEYDLILDENPRNPNMKMAMWTEMIPILQIAIKGGLFGLIAKIFDYAPYPESIVEEIKKELMAMAQKQEQQNPFGGKPGRGGANPAVDMAKVAKLQSAVQVDMARARALDAATRLKGFEVGVDTGQKMKQMQREGDRHAHDTAQTRQRMRHESESHNMDQLSSAIEAIKNAQEPTAEA